MAASPLDVLDATFVAGAGTYGSLPPPAFSEIAFAGRSNVGKSSLINSLLNRRKLVRTSSTPGCTRAINIFHVQLRTAEFDLVDLPGYGYAKRSKTERIAWGELIEDFLTHRAGLRGVVLIVDVRRGILPDDEQLLSFLKSIGRPSVLVATKIDKLGKSERRTAIAAIKKSCRDPLIAYSAVDHEGREPLFRKVLELAGIEVKEA